MIYYYHTWKNTKTKRIYYNKTKQRYNTWYVEGDAKIVAVFLTLEEAVAHIRSLPE